MNSNTLNTNLVQRTDAFSTEGMDLEFRTSSKKRPLEDASNAPESKKRRVCNSIVNERLVECLSKASTEALLTFAHAAYMRGGYNDFEDVVLAVFLKFHGEYNIEHCRMLLTP